MFAPVVISNVPMQLLWWLSHHFSITTKLLWSWVSPPSLSIKNHRVNLLISVSSPPAVQFSSFRPSSPWLLWWAHGSCFLHLIVCARCLVDLRVISTCCSVFLFPTKLVVSFRFVSYTTKLWFRELVRPDRFVLNQCTKNKKKTNHWLSYEMCRSVVPLLVPCLGPYWTISTKTCGKSFKM